MILCIKIDSIKTSINVQRDVDLDTLLSPPNICYFNTTEEALEQGYVPLDFSVTIRSAYTNYVVETPSSTKPEEKRYYINMTNVDTLPHRGADLVMYLSSVGVISCVVYSPELDGVMMKTQFCPIGLYNPDPSIINPIMYSHIILKDDAVEPFTNLLKDKVNLVPIQDMKREGNLNALLETLILVEKGE